MYSMTYTWKVYQLTAASRSEHSVLLTNLGRLSAPADGPTKTLTFLSIGSIITLDLVPDDLAICR